jgi:hypothetical protein
MGILWKRLLIFLNCFKFKNKQYYLRRIDYIYNIFQQTSPTNLDPLLSDGLVETGRSKVLDLPVESNEFEQEIIFNIYE